MTGQLRTAVVTGGAGFIGRRLCRSLLMSDLRVRVVDRRAAAIDGCEHVRADLARDDVAEALRGDVVFHLAGRPGVRGDDPETERRRMLDNVVATERVLVATPPQVPVVFASSSSVYGGSQGAPCRETDLPAPRGGYAWSKVAAEQLCHGRVRAGGRVHVCRLFTVLGEGQRPDMALALWAAAVAADEPVDVYGGLERSRDFTDVDDVVAALTRIAVEPGSTVVNVGTGVGQRIGALVDAIGQHLGRRPAVRVVAAPREDPPATLADTARLRRILGRVPHTDLVGVVGRYLDHADDLAGHAASLSSPTEGPLR
jgi:nucleoside-diphosphate-sugar epimerase